MSVTYVTRYRGITMPRSRLIAFCLAVLVAYGVLYAIHAGRSASHRVDGLESQITDVESKIENLELAIENLKFKVEDSEFRRRAFQ